MTSVLNEPEASRDFLPTASWETLKARSVIVARIRQFFSERGFTEVDTPCLSRDTVVDRYLDPWELTADVPGGGPQRWFLQTSPEYHMKRLLVGGADKIYQIAHAFRRDEQGVWHNPEFCMLEWYEVAADYGAGRRTLAELAAIFFAGSVNELSYSEAFQQFAGCDPDRASVGELRQLAERSGGGVQNWSNWERDDLLNWLLAHQVQPRLGFSGPLLVYDWPATQAALARTRVGADGVEVAERYELYVRGVELANGYHELLDPDVLAARSREHDRWRQAAGKPPLPIHSRLEQALRQGLPPCSGVAVGLDRWVQLVLGLPQLSDVLTFPIDRA